MSTCMFIRSTVFWTARAASGSCPGSCSPWARPPAPSPTTGLCTALSISTGPVRQKGSSPSSAVRSMSRPRAVPGLTRFTNLTRRAAICVKTRRDIATSPIWSPWPGRRGFTTAPGWIWSSCGVTAAALWPCPRVLRGRFPGGCGTGSMRTQKITPWSSARSLGQSIFTWSFKITASGIRLW